MKPKKLKTNSKQKTRENEKHYKVDAELVQMRFYSGAMTGPVSPGGVQVGQAAPMMPSVPTPSVPTPRPAPPPGPAPAYQPRGIYVPFIGTRYRVRLNMTLPEYYRYVEEQRRQQQRYGGRFVGSVM